MKKGETEIYISKDGKTFKVFYHTATVSVIKESGAKDELTLDSFYNIVARDGWVIKKN
jgi:hypothetical protein